MMPGVIGLDGTDGKLIEVHFFRSVTEGMRNLKLDRATTAAGQDGAINIWIDDDGAYRGKLMAYQSTKALHSSKTLRELKEWLKTVLPQIGDQNEEAR